MSIMRTWLLPGCLALTQLALGPGLAVWPGPGPDGGVLVMAVAATGSAAAALGWRMRAPVAAFVAVMAVLTVGQLVLPDRSLIDIILLGEAIALYSVVARRSTRVGLIAAAGAVAVAATLAAVRYGMDGAAVQGLLDHLVFYALAWALGRVRYRQRAARQVTAERLARAEAERCAAAATERDRLAREMHDVAAHHLSSVVVIAAASERLAGQPELLTQALTFAADAGRRTQAALHRLVTVMDADTEYTLPLRVRVKDLASAFARLGQPVTVAVHGPAELSPALAESAYGIVREALTNALRHAPGAAVAVLLDHRSDALHLTVADDGTSGAAGHHRLGSGRGLAGMRERAGAVCGTVSAGPRPTGGWMVHAVLPLAPSGPPDSAERVVPPPPTRSARARRLRGALARRCHLSRDRILDVLLAVAAIAWPVATVFGATAAPDRVTAEWRFDPTQLRSLISGSSDPPITLFGLLLVAQAAPVLWRRRAPWRVLAAVVVVTCGWLPAIGQRWVSLDLASSAPSGFALCVAAYAVARWAAPAWLTWLAVPVAAGAVAVTAVAALAADGSMAGQPATPVTVLAVGIGIAFCNVPTLLGVWGAGLAVRWYRSTVDREREAVAMAVARAADAADAERSRIASGLRNTVLELTGRLTVTAAAGRQAMAGGEPATARDRLTETETHARTALVAMRDLLHTLRSDAGQAQLAPQPTAATIEHLCTQQRLAGRQVTLHVTTEVRSLPPEVDISAYRIVAAALESGDVEPASVALLYSGHDLRISVHGVPSATAGPVATALRERVSAVGGRLALRPGGTMDVLLPAPIEEVTPSPFG